MAFGQSGFGSREEREDPAGGLKAFAGGRGAPAPIRNSEEKQFADKAAGAVVNTALKNTSGDLLGTIPKLGGEAVTLGATNLGTLGTALKGVGTSVMGGGAGLGTALGTAGSAMLPFAGPLALAALPFLLEEGDTNVANDDDMDDEEIIAMNQAYEPNYDYNGVPTIGFDHLNQGYEPLTPAEIGMYTAMGTALPAAGVHSLKLLSGHNPGGYNILRGIADPNSGWLGHKRPRNWRAIDRRNRLHGGYLYPKSLASYTDKFKWLNSLNNLGNIIPKAATKFLGPLGVVAETFRPTMASDATWSDEEFAENMSYPGVQQYKGGTHKVAGIDPQKYNSGTGGAKNPPGIRSILGANPMQTSRTAPGITPSQLARMGASGINATASSAPKSAMSIHEIFRPTPGTAPNFAKTAEAGRNVRNNIKANEIRSMLNNLQNPDLKDNLSAPTGSGMLSKLLFRGAPLGAAASTLMTPTMAADATIQDPRREEFSTYLPPLAPPRTDRQLKEELHDQTLRHKEESHRAKMMAQ